MQPLKVSDEIVERLKGTVAVDEAGRPLVLHHGTLASFEKFARTRDIGFHFGTRRQALKRVHDASREKGAPKDGVPRVVSVALAARKPLVVPDDPVAWPASYLCMLFRRFLPDAEAAIVRKEAEALPFEEREKPVYAFIRRHLLAAGYDSIVYRNQYESEGRSRAGLEWSWCVLDPDILVPLGENVEATFIDAPEGVFGVNPAPWRREDCEGLRHRRGGLIYARDKEKFTFAAIEWLCARGATVETKDWLRELRRQRASYERDPEVKLQVEVAGRKMSVRIDPKHADVVLLLSKDETVGMEVYDDSAKNCVTHRGLSFHWTPGEKIEETLARAEAALQVLECAPAMALSA